MTNLPQWLDDFLSSPPHAGDGVNVWLFKAARKLHNYADRAEIARILRERTATCGREVKEAEITRAIERSFNVRYIPNVVRLPAVTGHKWPALDERKRNAVIAAGIQEVDLMERSPLIPLEKPDPAFYLTRLFPGDPLVCMGLDTATFATRPLSTFIGRKKGRGIADLCQVVPSPMIRQTGTNQEGKESEHCLENTGPRKYIVVEFDQGTRDEHAAILWHLKERGAPLAMVLFSGGKSIHGWFRVAGMKDEEILPFFRYAVALGADWRLWNRTQFVRTPDAWRADKNATQHVIYADL